MSNSLMVDQPVLHSQSDEQDPFATSTGSGHHRFTHFDNALYGQGPATAPDQAKRTLEAHIAETERRIQEASKLGTTLIQQRKELAERLVEVEKQHDESDITPELRQKLVEIEKEYNEVGRESARAFLPKSRVSSSESPFKRVCEKSYSCEYYLMLSSALSAPPSSKARPQIPPRSSMYQTTGDHAINQPIVYMISNLRPRLVRLCYHK